MDEKYKDLANAIIIQAVKDYREARRALARCSDNREALHEKRTLLRFFRSRWFRALTDTDPKALIDRLDGEEARA